MHVYDININAVLKIDLNATLPALDEFHGISVI
jgi:hypothetical protein